MKIYNRDPKTGKIKKGHTVLTKDQRDDKFLELVNIRNDPAQCWNWLGSIDTKGYGRFHIGNHKYAKAHRYSYELRYGKISVGKVIDHICRNRACVNSVHLREVSSRENSLENSIGTGAINKKKTHCKYGHEFNKLNTGLNCNGGRWCKTCNRTRHART